MIIIAKELSFEDLEKKAHYYGIITLLFLYGGYENGLRQQHFRYFLMENPIFSKKKETHEKKMEYFKKFFEDGGIYISATDDFKKSPDFEKIKYLGVVKGCIKSRQKLTNYLKKLEEMNIIEKSCDKKPDVRYKLTKYYRLETLKRYFWGCMDEHDNDKIFTQGHFSKLMDKNYNPTGTTGTGHENWILFGLSPRIIKNLTPLEKNQFKERLTSIEKNLHDILEMIHRKQGSEEFPSNICYSFLGHRWKL